MQSKNVSMFENKLFLLGEGDKNNMIDFAGQNKAFYNYQINCEKSPFNNLSIPFKKQRKRVAVACIPCNRAKTSCDGTRPCKRCITRQMIEKCENVVHKKKGRPKKKMAHLQQFPYYDNTLTNGYKKITSDPYSNIKIPELDFLDAGSDFVSDVLLSPSSPDSYNSFRSYSPTSPLGFSPFDISEIAKSDSGSPAYSSSNLHYRKNFKNRIRMIWYHIWQANVMKSFIEQSMVSPLVHFSVSMLRISLSKSEFDCFLQQLYRVFTEMGFTAPTNFQLFNFEYMVDSNTKKQNVELRNLPIIYLRVRFKLFKNSTTDVKTKFLLSYYAQKVLGINEKEFVDAMTSEEQEEKPLPFFWRFIAPNSWDFLMQMEQLACGGITPTEGYQSQFSLLTANSQEVQCWGVVKYTKYDGKVLHVAEYLMLPLTPQSSIPFESEGKKAIENSLLVSNMLKTGQGYEVKKSDNEFSNNR